MNTSPVPFSQGFCQKVTAPSVTSAVAWSRSCASCSFEAYLTSDARSAQPLARAIEARDALAALLPAIAHVHVRKIIHTDITAAARKIIHHMQTPKSPFNKIRKTRYCPPNALLPSETAEQIPLGAHFGRSSAHNTPGAMRPRRAARSAKN